MYQMRRRTAVLILVVVLLVGALTVPAFAAGQQPDGFTAQIIGFTDSEEGKTITIAYDNQTDGPVSLGWVNSCEVVVTTDEGVFSRPVSVLEQFEHLSVGKGEFSFLIERCTGNVQSLELTDLRVLDDQGLPERELGGIVIAYDGQTAAPPTANDALPIVTQAPPPKVSSSKNNPFSILTVIIPILVVVLMIAIVVIRIFLLKKTAPIVKWGYNKVMERVKNDEQGDGAQKAGEAGEREVNHKLEWWLRGHPEYRLVKRDCISKYSNACIRISNPPRYSEPQEIDHLLVGPEGIIQIETKNWSGTIDIVDTETWRRQQYDGTWKQCESPADQVSCHEKILESISSGRLNVFSFICIANANTQVINMQNSRCPVVPIQYLKLVLDKFVKEGASRGHSASPEVVAAVLADIERHKVRGVQNDGSEYDGPTN